MDNAAAIVIGSGAFGASTAYDLARRGAKVVLIDQHALGSQTSRVRPGSEHGPVCEEVHALTGGHAWQPSTGATIATAE